MIDFAYPVLLAKLRICSGQSKKSRLNGDTVDNVKGKDRIDGCWSKPIGILVNKQWARLFPQSNQCYFSIQSTNSLKLTHNGVVLPSIICPSVDIKSVKSINS